MSKTHLAALPHGCLRPVGDSLRYLLRGRTAYPLAEPSRTRYRFCGARSVDCTHWNAFRISNTALPWPYHRTCACAIPARVDMVRSRPSPSERTSHRGDWYCLQRYALNSSHSTSFSPRTLSCLFSGAPDSPATAAAHYASSTSIDSSVQRTMLGVDTQP